jgi:NAD+ diphosphatase
MNRPFAPPAAEPERSALTGFAGGRTDRAAALREDEAARAALRAAGNARFILLAGEKPAVRRETEGFAAWFGAAQLAPFRERITEEVFLGVEDEAGLFGVRLDPVVEEALKADGAAIVLDLRSLAMQGLLPAVDLAAVGAAKALTDWHARHRFCANCGAPTTAQLGGWRRGCSGCGAQHFPRTDPVAIMLVTHLHPEHGERCLLARQPRFPPGMYSAIAGFVEPGETIEAAVRRETFEETGLGVGRVDYVASQPWPFPSSLMIGCMAEALDDAITLDITELEDARWFSRDEARAMLERRHPDGLTSATPIAIASTLLKAWLGE